MGLMYIFPVTDDKNESGDQLEIKEDKTIRLRTYGLPFIFWGYLAAAVTVVALMYMASRAVIAKLLTYDDALLQFLGHLVFWSLVLTPIVLLAFFFYEKNIIKKGSELKLVHKIFFIPLWQKKIQLKSPDSIFVEHFLDSPNMAKIRNQYAQNKNALKQFENKGYFELVAETSTGNKIIDRHSRKADLLKMKDLLSRY